MTWPINYADHASSKNFPIDQEPDYNMTDHGTLKNSRKDYDYTNYEEKQVGVQNKLKQATALPTEKHKKRPRKGLNIRGLNHLKNVLPHFEDAFRLLMREKKHVDAGSLSNLLIKGTYFAV